MCVDCCRVVNNLGFLFLPLEVNLDGWRLLILSLLYLCCPFLILIHKNLLIFCILKQFLEYLSAFFLMSVQILACLEINDASNLFCASHCLALVVVWRKNVKQRLVDSNKTKEITNNLTHITRQRHNEQ